MPEHREDQVSKVRKSAGFARLDDTALIQVSGPDAAVYLQGRTSNDIIAVADGHGQLNCLLHRKGHVLALFSLHRAGTDYYILAESSQSPLIMEQLETYKFREKVEFADKSSNYSLFAVQGPQSEMQLAALDYTNLPTTEYGTTATDNGFIFRKSMTGDNGYILAVATESAPRIESKLSAHLIALDDQDLETMRIEAGIPAFGKEVTPEYLLPETGLEQYAASYSKGCFQGQEILARIKTYGAPRQALVGLVFETAPQSPIAMDTQFSINEQEAGLIKSNCYSPTFGKYVALAYIAREYRIPEKEVQIELKPHGTHLAARVMFLPLYQPESSKQRARSIYTTALAEFAHGSELRAIDMLREVVDLDPHFADAYESLGVILSRQKQLDEAIALMHRLASLDPQSIMAHANLSLYYMQLGEIEKAEEEKAVAMGIQMSKIAREVVAKQKEDEERKKRAEEAQQRMEMFGQVLTIDSEDLLANYGMGSALLDSGKPAEAIPYLGKAIRVKPSHTVAWLALGKAYEELTQFESAVSTYEQGVITAAKRGDITPMNEMKARLEELKRRLLAPNTSS